MRTIERDAVKRHLDNGDPMVLVEALPAKYFNEAHLPGALQINHDEVAAKAPKLLPDKGAKIVVYCANTACQNSTKAARALQDLGYTDVHEYVEGKADWQAAGLPTANGGA
jgi:rhodanese-related sulfurtransferase